MEPGDVVQLVSGGLPMTVAGPGKNMLGVSAEDDSLECVWSIQGSIRSHIFPVAVLVPYAPPQSPPPSGLGRPKRKSGPT